MASYAACCESVNFWRRQDAQASLALHLTLMAGDHALLKASAFPLIRCNKFSLTLNSVWLGDISLRRHVSSMHQWTRRGSLSAQTQSQTPCTQQPACFIRRQKAINYLRL